MMKKSLSMLLLCVAVVLASCSKNEQTPDQVSVAFSSLTANGSATGTTTGLTLTFNKVIEGLSAADITLTAGETGAVKGDLTAKTDGVYELAVSGVTKGGEVSVAVAKTDYTITPASKKVTVSYMTPAKVGDFYYSDNTYSTTINTGKTCVGIVFWVDPADATKGKIVSLDEALNLCWSTENIDTGATSDTDGATNTTKVLALDNYSASVYPAFGWCAAKNATAPSGIKWYIPATNELETEIYANKTILDASLGSVSGAATLSIWYWTSTQLDASEAYIVHYNVSNTVTTEYGKDNTDISVRVVSAF